MAKQTQGKLHFRF